MACGPNRAPGRCEVPPSNGAPITRMSVPARVSGSDRSALATPRNVASGPYILPILLTTPPQRRRSRTGVQFALPGQPRGYSRWSSRTAGHAKFPVQCRWQEERMADARPAPDFGRLIVGISGDSRRRLSVQGTLNFRDIGGYPVRGGGTTAWRTLFRSDALHRVDDDGSGVIAELDLKTVIDLRVLEELMIAQSPLSDFADRGTRTLHLSL